MLIRGAPGSGKSDLALRLIEEGARLVADDRTDLAVVEGRLVATAPPAIAGKLEVRGIGIVDVRMAAEAPVVLIVDLRRADQIERLPERGVEGVAGVSVPRIDVAPFEASASAKIRLALRLINDNIF